MLYKISELRFKHKSFGHSLKGFTVIKFMFKKDHFLGSKITADGNCSHEIKKHLLLGKKKL